MRTILEKMTKNLTKKRRRPRLRRFEDARSILGIRNWIATTLDRDKWQKLMEEIKVQNRVLDSQR